MAEETEQDDKTEEPTQKRLDEARAKGEVIYSPEAASWISLAFAALAISAFGAGAAETLGRLALHLLAEPEQFSADPKSLLRLLQTLGGRVAAAFGLIFLAIAAAGVASRFLQDRPALSLQRLTPDINRLNPMSGFKRVFGPHAVANFLKALAKLAVVGAAALWALWPRDGMLDQAVLLDPAALMSLVKERVMSLLGACLIAFALVAGADYFFTRQSFMKRMRMTRQELKEEFRQSEGDPHVKAKLKQIRMQRAQKRMMQDVPNATVVIANPTHYAVALRYDRDVDPAPKCVAKGVDEIALRIRAVAEENDVPVIEDPPLARALYGAAEIDRIIPREHYEAVAKVIGLVMRLANRRRPSRSPPRTS